MFEVGINDVVDVMDAPDPLLLLRTNSSLTFTLILTFTLVLCLECEEQLAVCAFLKSLHSHSLIC